MRLERSEVVERLVGSLEDERAVCAEAEHPLGLRLLEDHVAAPRQVHQRADDVTEVGRFVHQRTDDGGRAVIGRFAQVRRNRPGFRVTTARLQPNDDEQRPADTDQGAGGQNRQVNQRQHVLVIGSLRIETGLPGGRCRVWIVRILNTDLEALIAGERAGGGRGDR